MGDKSPKKREKKKKKVEKVTVQPTIETGTTSVKKPKNSPRKPSARMRLHYKKAERKSKGQEAILAALEPSAFSSHYEYLNAVKVLRKKLYHLEQELKSLKAGKLPGGWA